MDEVTRSNRKESLRKIKMLQEIQMREIRKKYVLQTKVGLLDKFGIELDNISHYHILAVDPGAGEWSGARAVTIDGKMSEVKDLFVLSDKQACKDFSVLYYSKNANKWLIGQGAGKQAANREAKRTFYENFKVVPGSPAAMECYGNYYENPTMEELMVRNFQCIMERFLVEVDNGLKDKKLIIFVGRPASRDWEEVELTYRDKLYQALGEIEGVKKEDIQIAMVSEAQASLAAEIYDKGLDLKSGVCQVVIDVGSSTVDVIVVKDGKVIGEYSRQIGAGLIEENMLELFLYNDCNPAGVESNLLDQFFLQDREYQQIVSSRKKLREALHTIPYIRANNSKEFKFSKIEKFNETLDTPPALARFYLRIAKENFFGKDGIGGTECPAPIRINGKRETFYADQETMEKAICQMPIFVPCTEKDERDNPYKGVYIYRSYYDALAHFIDGVKEMYLAGESTPDVILTGGASVMPFVGRLVKEKFGVAPTNSNQPSYTVSRGLAYIGYAEIKKQEELLAINDLISKTFKKNNQSLANDIRKSFSKWYVSAIMTDFEDWKTSNKEESLENVIYKTRYYNSDKIGEIDLVRTWWTNLVEPEIVKQIKKRFESLYKNANVQYDFIINPQIVENAYKAGETTPIKHSWCDLLGIFSGLILDPNKTDYTHEQREKFYNRANDRRGSMETKIGAQQPVIDMADRHANEILNGFNEELCKDVVTYVEGLTPYIVRR